MVREVKLYIHPYCLSSYKVVKSLIREGIVNKLTIISTEFSIKDVFSRQIISVPWLVIDNIDVATDPLEPELV